MTEPNPSGEGIMVNRVWMAAAAALAAAPAAADGPDVSRLGAREYEARRAATRRLWRAGPRAEAELRRATKHPDPEVAARARRLLRELDWGLTPDTPDEIAREVRRFRGGDDRVRRDALVQLIGFGRAAVPALSRLTAKARQQNRAAALVGFASTAVRGNVAAWSRGGEPGTAGEVLEGLLPLGESVMRDYAALQLTPGMAPTDVKTWEARFRDADKADREWIGRTLVFLCRVREDWAKAAEYARRVSDTRLIGRVLWEAGDWKGLAELGPLAPDGRDENAFAMSLAYGRLGGQTERAAAARAALIQVAGTPSNEKAVRGLLFNGEYAAAEAALRKAGPSLFLFELLCWKMQYDEALKLHAGMTGPEIDVSVGKVLWNLGRRDEAMPHLDRAAESLLSSNGPKFRLLNWERSLNDDSLVLKHTTRLLEVKPGDASEWLEYAVDEPTPRAAYRVWDYWKAVEPGLSTRERLRRLKRLYEGRAGDDFAPWIGPLMKAAEGSQSGPVLLGLARMSVAAGRDADAARLYRRAAAAGMSVSNDLGDALCRRNDFPAAAAAYTEPALRGRALFMAGRGEEGRRLIRAAGLTPLGNTSLRTELYTAMLARGMRPQALRQADAARRTTWYSNYLTGRSLRAGSAMAAGDGDYETAARLHRQANLGTLLGTSYFYEPSAYMRLPQQVRVYDAAAALKAGRTAEGLKTLDECLKVRRGNYLVAEVAGPVLAGLGKEKLARKYFDLALDPHRELLKKYPDSGYHLNTVAWTSAVAKRNLDEGLKCARRAVKLYPNCEMYLDTLAEVLFQRGETAEAIELIQKCIRGNPDRAYYKMQLERFRAGERDTPPPEEL